MTDIGRKGSINKLDSKRYLALVKKTRKSVSKALDRYGKPPLSLEELRRQVDEQLGDRSLSDYVLSEREAGW